MEKVYAMNQAALDYYQMSLTDDDERAAKARQYIEKRGWKKETVHTFRLGYAPDKWTALYYHLKEAGYTDEEQEMAGLVSKSRKNGKYYDRFRNRVIFPIINPDGTVAGFGARALSDEDKPKYLNTSESPVFKKRQLLYGLDLAGLSQSNCMILVEGYTDVISLYDAGIDNAVATLGTALSEDHAKVIEQHADGLYLCFDGDEAGVAAATRAIEKMSGTTLKARVLTLPDCQDPDEVVHRKGKDAFLEALKKAPEAMAYQIGLIKQETGFNTCPEKIAFATESASFLRRHMENPDVNKYIRAIANRLNIPEQLYAEKVFGQKWLAERRRLGYNGAK